MKGARGFKMSDTMFGYKKGKQAFEDYLKRVIPHPERLTNNQLEELRENFKI